MLERIEIGTVTRTHGLKGEVCVYPTTDEPDRFSDLQRVYAVRGDRSLELEIERVIYVKGRPVIKFKGYDDIDAAAALREYVLSVDRADAIPLLEGEYFIGDLVGCGIFLEDGSRFGTLTDVLRTGANDVYAVRTEDGEMRYLPAISEVILSIEPEEGRITARPMKEI